MIIKSYTIENNIQNLEKYNCLLFYGENNGLIDFFKREIKKNNKDIELEIIYQNDIIENKEIIVDKILNSSLFSEKKILILNEISDKVYEAIEEAAMKTNENNKVYIFSSKLEKRSKLRKFFEEEKKVGIVACYNDNERSLSEYISKELIGFDNLNHEVKNIIISGCNMDRGTIFELLSKIKIFFLDKKINIEKLKKLIDPQVKKDFEMIRDTSLVGNKNKLNILLSEIDLTSEDNYYLLNILNFKLNKLNDLVKFKQKSSNVKDLVDSYKPVIFWKEKQNYIDLLNKWDVQNIKIALNKSKEAELKIKKSDIRNDIIIKNLLIDICVQALISLKQVRN